MEKEGVSCVALVTQPFEEDAAVTAETFGMPSFPSVIMDTNTLTNLPESEIIMYTDRIVEKVLDALLQDPPVKPRALAKGIGASKLADEEIFEGEDRFDAWERMNACFLERGWGDGFPLIPPTREKVEAMLAGCKHSPEDVVAVLEPGMGVATVEKIAINAVMAGCKPGSLPLLIAAVKAMSDPSFLLRVVSMSTGPHCPMMVVNGPIVKKLGINSGRGALGPGKQSQVNTALGRAVRLILMNIGHAYVGSMDLDTIGSPNKYSMCIAENEEASPWEPYHVERGYDRNTSTVTMFSVESQLEVYDLKNETPEGILNTYAGTINTVGAASTRYWLIPRRRGENAVLLSPDHAAAIARAGWTKEDIKRYLFTKATIPAKFTKNTVEPDRIMPGLRWVLDAPDDLPLPIVGGYDWFHVIVVGGPAGKSSYTTGMGRAVTCPVDE